MNIQDIAFKNCNGILIHSSTGEAAEQSVSFVNDMVSLGFMPNDELTEALTNADANTIATLEKNVLPILKKSVGAHVKHKPLYPDFPNENTADAGVYVNDLLNFLQTGVANDNFSVDLGFENVKFRTLKLVTSEDIRNVFAGILASADSITDFNKKVIKYLILIDYVKIPKNIPFKENLCIVAGEMFKQGKWDNDLVKTPTDVLRIATYLSDGDVSLAENTKFKNMPRSQRRILVQALERVTRSEEDFVKHSGKWVKLFHMLHVGDYSDKMFKVAKKFRENEKVRTFDGKLEAAIENGSWVKAIDMLETRPGVFARNVGRLLTNTSATQRQAVCNAFAGVVDDVPTRNLTQLWGSFKTRDEVVDKRVVFPKGSTAKAYVLRNILSKIPKKYVEQIIDMVKASLTARFAKEETLGKVYIDPALGDCPLPTGMRSSSDALKEVARGTRLPFGDEKVLRFFIYWKGIDIDLSASLHDEDFNLVQTVSYYSHGGSDAAYYSGDETNAPNGASEFIDINIANALKTARYLAMNVHVYSGPTFAEHEECFAGWMTRGKINSGAIYDPRTVQNKVDLRSDTKNAIPVLFDLKERKAIWADVNATGRRFQGRHRLANNVENNKATIEDMCEAFVSLDNKISLKELFELHAEARGEITEYPAEANTVFSINESVDDNDEATVITPFDIIDINSKFVV